MPQPGGPIGIFDSGVGGLAVLREVRRLLPGEDLVYYADTAYFPYGPRPRDEIVERAHAITQELLERGTKLVVVACNTATSAAVAHLRSRYDVPFVSIEPALKPAAERTVTGTVALLVTPGTARGEKLAALIDRHGRGVDARVIEAPGLAEQVEAGALDGAETLSMVRRFSDEVRGSGADVLALGCTHYAFLRAAFERALGDGISVLEPSEAVARQVERVLDERGLRSGRESGGRTVYVCSGDAAAFAVVRDAVLSESVGVR